MSETPQRFERINDEEWKSTFGFDGPKFITRWFEQFNKSYPSAVLVRNEPKRYYNKFYAVIIFTDGADEAEFIMREGYIKDDWEDE